VHSRICLGGSITRGPLKRIVTKARNNSGSGDVLNPGGLGEVALLARQLISEDLIRRETI
jgi:hypothetical protein